MAKPPEDNHYDAFISYRHAELDKRVAQRLQQVLEAYRVPRSLCKKGTPRKLNRVFRDEEELVAGDFPPRLCRALDESRYFIVICSPRTPSSKWVCEEITHFQSLGRHDKILPVLVEGEPAESYPDAIRNSDLLAADLRPPERWRSRLKTERLRLLARLFECDFDELYLRQHRRFVRRLTAALCCALVFLGVLGFTGYGWVEERARAKALQQIDDVRASLQSEINDAQRWKFTGRGPNHDLMVLGSKLTEMKKEYIANFGPQTSFTELEDLIIRNAKATVENAEREFHEALDLYKSGDRIDVR